jgi:hypothetical protein
MQSGAQDLVVDSTDVNFDIVDGKLYLPVETAVLGNASKDACSSLLVDVLLGASLHDDLFHGNGIRAQTFEEPLANGRLLLGEIFFYRRAKFSYFFIMLSCENFFGANDQHFAIIF